MLKISIIILASRPRCLRRCLESLARAGALEDSECLLVLNGEDLACAGVALEFSGRICGLKTLRGAPRSLGGARNAALAQASGRWLCFLDDDVAVPPDYFSILAEKTREHPGASVIGGPNKTPPQSPLFERCAGLILGSPLSAGPMSRRCGGFKTDSWADESGFILCNLCILKEALVAEGLGFDEELARNEENLLLARLSLKGHRALHAPGLFVYHERRSTLAAFLRQCFLSGHGRGEMTVKLPETLRALHLLPLLPLFGSPALLLFPRALAGPAAAYAALALANAALLAWDLRSFRWLALLFATAHLSYGAGLLAGSSRGAVRRIFAGPRMAAAHAR